jgi:hypothetical protein
MMELSFAAGAAHALVEWDVILSGSSVFTDNAQ